MLITQTLESDLPEVESQLTQSGAGTNYSFVIPLVSWPVNGQTHIS